MPRRQVSVELELDAHGYIGESTDVIGVTKAVKAELDDLGDKADKTGKDLEKLAVDADLAKHEVDDLGDKAVKTAVEMEGLDKRIKAAKLSVGQLSLEFARTGDLATKKDLNEAKRALAILEKTRRDILAFAAEDVASRAATLASAGIADTVGKSLFSAFKGTDFRGLFMKILIPALVAVSPAIGAILAGAVVGVVGLGGLAGGILSAIKQPAVVGAFHQFAAQISADFFGGASSTAFAGPIVQSLGMLSRAFHDLDLGDAFALAAPSLTTFTQGIIDFAKNAMPGFLGVLGDSGPIMKALADGLGRIGTGLSTFLKEILSSRGTVLGLADGLHLVAWAIEGLGKTLHFLGDLYDLLKPLGSFVIAPVVHWIGMLTGGIGDLVASLDDLEHRLTDGPPTAVLINSNKNATIATQGLTQATYNLAEAHKFAHSQTDQFRMSVDQLTQSLDASLDRNLALWAANLDAQQALADATQTIKENGRQWDQNTDKARDNQRAIKDGIEALKQQRDAAIANSDGSTAAIKKINEQYDAELQILLNLAKQAGATKDELDKLAGTYTVKVNTIVNGAGSDDRKQDQAFQHQSRPSGRAAGGSVLAGVTYRVAEQRPEVYFRAPADGMVIPWSSVGAAAASTPPGGAQMLGLTVSVAPGADQQLLSGVLQYLRFTVDTQYGGSAQLALTRGRR